MDTILKINGKGLSGRPSAAGRRIVKQIIAVIIVLFACGAAPLQAQGVLRIAAVVNDRVVSVLDVIERMKFVMFSTGMPNTADNQRRLSQQILRTLVDEEMQLQEAKKQNITVSDRDIDNAIRTLEERNQMQPGDLEKLLQSRQISIATLRKKLEAEIAWGRTVSRKLRSEARVSDDAIDEELARIESQLSQPRLRVSEILLGIDDPNQEDEVRRTALRLKDQLNAGSNFAALARSFSQSTTASVGGDLGWIQAGLLSDELDAAIASMNPGDVSDPIRTVAGYHLLYLRDRQTVAGSDVGDTVIDLRQIVFPLAKGATAAETEAQQAAADQIRTAITGCDDLPALIESVGTSESGSLGNIRLGDLPQNIQAAVGTLNVGEASQPVVSDAGPVILFVVCGREAPMTNLPDRKEVQDQLTNKRFELLSRQYLRDLRRNAYVDLRE
ncbi:MAG: peptidylprolyl isomerase [Alphaproteobacteria bacterium]